MRAYAKVSPSFWTGHTGRAIRAQGPAAQLTALYLVTGPMANMIGLYYLPPVMLAHETGFPWKKIQEALGQLARLEFACYDRPTEYVWVPEMARHQLGEHLTPKDNRHSNLVELLTGLRACVFFERFIAKYREPFNLPDLKPLRSPFEAPSKGQGVAKGRAGEEQEQELELEQDNTTSPRAEGGAGDWSTAEWPSPEALADMYNRLTPDNVPPVKSLSLKRRDQAKKMLRQFPERAWWEETFARYHRSQFLSGRTTPSNGHAGFRPDFDWLLANGKTGTENAVKVHDGNYR